MNKKVYGIRPEIISSISRILKEINKYDGFKLKKVIHETQSHRGLPTVVADLTLKSIGIKNTHAGLDGKDEMACIGKMIYAKLNLHDKNIPQGVFVHGFANMILRWTLTTKCHLTNDEVNSLFFF